MDTETAILITQIPIAIAIFVLAYEIHATKKVCLKLLENIVNKIK